MKNRHLIVRLRVFLQGARTTGFAATVGARVGRLFRDTMIWLAFLPVTCVLHLLGFRRLTVITSRIGHLAVEVDCFLKAKALGDLPARRFFLLAPPGAAANTHLLEYWRPHLSVVTHPLACVVLSGMSRWWLMRYDVGHYAFRLNLSQEMYRLNARWTPRPPLLMLSQEDQTWTDDAFAKLGLPPDAWFVCVHVREPGFSPVDEAQHAHRNADPHATIPAMRYIAKRGGWCIRMGDSSMTPLPKLPNVIDYAHYPLKSHRLDVVLCARARFFLGNTSGIGLVSTVFGVPSALANMVPIATLAPLKGDLSIPKLIFSRKEQRLLRFPEIFASPLANFRFAELYDEADVDLCENGPDEIVDLVREMLDRLEGKVVEHDDDADLQRRYLGLFRPGDYSWGAVSRIGIAFLRKYRPLLVP